MKYFLYKAMCFKKAKVLFPENKILWSGYRNKNLAKPLSTANSPVLAAVERRYEEAGNEAVESALSIMSSHNWTTEVFSGDDVVESKYLPNHGKIFRFQGVIDSSPEEVFEQIYMKVEQSSEWNKSVKSSKVLEKINDKTDVVHVVTNEEAGGLVASRSFVIVRTWQQRGNAFINGYTSVIHSSELESSDIRGEQGPCAYIITRVEDNPRRCHVQWLLCTKLKGWIPQRVIDTCVSSAMMNCIQSLRTRISSIQNVNDQITFLKS